MTDAPRQATRAMSIYAPYFELLCMFPCCERLPGDWCMVRTFLPFRVQAPPALRHRTAPPLCVLLTTDMYLPLHGHHRRLLVPIPDVQRVGPV